MTDRLSNSLGTSEHSKCVLRLSCRRRAYGERSEVLYKKAVHCRFVGRFIYFSKYKCIAWYTDDILEFRMIYKEIIQ